ncbi:MAG: HlyD family secretion protein [Myxococcota bacterium]
MFEVLFCSLLTILPDYLFRRYVQGKRIGRDLNFFSVWYELRYGITGCVTLTILLITVVFYSHPSTTNATLVFRSVPIIAEVSGRVATVNVGPRGEVKAGDVIFTLDPSAAKAAVQTARQRVAEIDARVELGGADLETAQGQLRQAKAALRRAQEDLESKNALQRSDPGIVARRRIEDLESIVEARRGAVDTARGQIHAAELAMSASLPSQRETAEAQLAEALTQLEKTVVRAGVDARVEQFSLRVGELVNPFMRPAGVLIPSDAGHRTVAAGFGQVEAQVIKVGMIAEITCAALPLTIIPMVVADVQPAIASGQVRASDQLVDVAGQSRPPGTVLAYLEPLFEGGLDELPPGAQCIANAYSNHHEELEDPETGLVRYVALHAVDTLALIHAGMLRSEALTLPIKTLVLSGGH